MKNKLLHFIIVFSLCSFSFIGDENPEELTVSVEDFAKDHYQQLKDHSLLYKPFKLGIKGYYKLLNDRKIQNLDYITIVDFTKPSNDKRMYIIDTKEWKIVHRSLVAHGMKTGELFAKDFSNEDNSHQSSLGFYLTGEVYNGKHDKSLKLDGYEYSNSHARERGVVIHAADYVSSDYIKSNGRLGRSYGCPAIPHEGYDDVIDKIKGGSLFFIYYPDKYYMKKSKFVNTQENFKLTCEGKVVKSS